MARKLRITPLQRDILWLLEEAGEEDVTTVIASLKPLTSEALDNAVKGLVRLGFVARSEWPERAGGSILLTKAGRESLTK
jgi:hypothetical protein